MAKKTRSKELILFHHNPLYDDEQLSKIESMAQDLFKKTTTAKQGLVIYL
jgi:ribonuclease BN (tRNA processing enzyme)